MTPVTNDMPCQAIISSKDDGEISAHEVRMYLGTGPVPIKKTIVGECNTCRTDHADSGGLSGIPVEKTLLIRLLEVRNCCAR
jgi:hypothetical protein